MSALHIVNPCDRETGRYAGTRRYVLWFGQCAPTFIMVWSRSLEDALETAAAYLAEHAPGHIMTEDSEELADLRREACEERAVSYEAFANGELGLDDPEAWDAIEQAATADLTHTESGYITSYEWGIQFDDHADRADVKAWIAELEARHYGDSPAVFHPGNG